jgi:periplasmic protein TonB
MAGRITMVVDADGMPQDIHVVHSLEPAFDENAIKAVGQYRFKPAMFQGKTVPVEISIEVNFRRY